MIAANVDVIRGAVATAVFGHQHSRTRKPRQTLEVTDRSYIIDDGHVIAEGAPRNLINNPQVREAYLGSTFKGDEFDQPVAATR